MQWAENRISMHRMAYPKLSYCQSEMQTISHIPFQYSMRCMRRTIIKQSQADLKKMATEIDYFRNKKKE